MYVTKGPALRRDLSVRCSPRCGRRFPRHRAGFSLLEIIIAVSIVAILVGAALPVTSKVLNYQARIGTQTEIQLIAEASTDYFRDTGVLPADVGGLQSDPGVAGWAGPYLPGAVIDPITGLSGHEVDAWSQPYRFTGSGDVMTILSRGSDRTPLTADDLTLAMDVTPVRRELTLDRLRIINQAILLYNGVYQTTEPLPADYDSVLRALVRKGFLPDDDRYKVDAWGKPFVEDPSGLAPVVRVASQSLDGSPSSVSAQSTSGASKSKKKSKKNP